MQQLSTTERIAKTHRQIELVETALTKEFPTQSTGVIHREVTTVSEELIANARSQTTSPCSQVVLSPSTSKLTRHR